MATKRPFTAPPGIKIPSTGTFNLDNTAASNGDSRDSQFSQVLVYNRALSAAEVLQNYKATKKRYGL
jgi:hypothetical protein